MNLPPGWTVTPAVEQSGTGTGGANSGPHGSGGPTPPNWFSRTTYRVRNAKGTLVAADGSEDAAVSQALSLIQSGSAWVWQ